MPAGCVSGQFTDQAHCVDYDNPSSRKSAAASAATVAATPTGPLATKPPSTGSIGVSSDAAMTSAAEPSAFVVGTSSATPSASRQRAVAPAAIGPIQWTAAAGWLVSTTGSGAQREPERGETEPRQDSRAASRAGAASHLRGAR